jgi:hypothetical protein
VVFVPPIPAEGHWIPIRRSTQRSGGCLQATGRTRAGLPEKAANIIRRIGQHVEKKFWAALRLRAKLFFPVFIYRTQFLIVSVQILGKFHTVFSTQVIPTKICLENAKVTEIFLKSLKFMNFIHVSAANS